VVLVPSSVDQNIPGRPDNPAAVQGENQEQGSPDVKSGLLGRLQFELSGALCLLCTLLADIVLTLLYVLAPKLEARVADQP
jgi:hypothetical protein